MQVTHGWSFSLRAPFCLNPRPLKLLSKGNIGFTLVELLAVVAIIGILVSLTMLSVGAFTRSSQRVTSLSNLHTIVGAWNMYAADHDGNFPIGLTYLNGAASTINPPSVPSEAPSLNYRYWWRYMAGVSSYLPTRALYDQEGLANGDPRIVTSKTVWRGYYPAEHATELFAMTNIPYTGYHFNTYIGLYRRTKLAQISSSARTPLLFGYFDPSSPDAPVAKYYCDPIRAPAIFEKGAIKALGTGNLFGFADGHVSWVEAMPAAADYQKMFVWNPFSP